MERCRKRKSPSLDSPETPLIFQPKSAKNSLADELIAPSISNAIGRNMYAAGRLQYLVIFLVAANSATAPADLADALSLLVLVLLPQLHPKSTLYHTVTGWESCHLGVCRRCVREWQEGSFVAGTWLEAKTREITSLMTWCLAHFPGANLQKKAWSPRASTWEPQWHAWAKVQSQTHAVRLLLEQPRHQSATLPASLLYMLLLL